MEPPVLFLNITTNVKTLFSEKIANEPSHNILVLIDGSAYPVHIYIQRMEVDEWDTDQKLSIQPLWIARHAVT